MPPKLSFTRRTFLGSSAIGSLIAVMPLRSIAQGAMLDADFMVLSQFVTGHKMLDVTVGQGLLTGLRAQYPDFDAQASALQAQIDARKPADVQALADALGGNPLHDTLLAIVRGWYSGVVAEGSHATVYAFEKALMYRPSLDAVPIPTYALNGPNWWTAEPPALSAMPSF